jgi:putative nucleotidyltransferase with HDIG domain
VVPEDITSPRRITYISNIETEITREAAAAAVPDVYDAADARVARQQVLYARQVMEFVNTVRHDTLATAVQQRDYLADVNDVELSSESADLLLTMSDSRFDSVADEITSLLAEVMSGEVREGRLDEVNEGLLLQVSVDLPEEFGPLVTDVVEDLLQPNSTFNAELTEEAREAAIQAVGPVEQTFAAGEVVVREGDIVTESDIEALQELGLLQDRIGWRDVVSRLTAVLISTVILVLYLVRFHPVEVATFKNQLLGGGLFVLFLLGARLIVPEGAIIPYLFPAAALALLLTALFGPDVALVNVVVLAGLTGLIARESLELATFAAVGGIVATVSLRRAERLNRFFLAGVFVSLSQAAVIVMFRLADPGTDWLGLLQLIAAALFNGLVSAGFALAGLFVIGPLFRITTPLTLTELERPDHPLLLRLQREAPGTFQHSLQVRNLAEAAANAIDANSLLVRVGTLYHDVGKVLRPGFFIENRVAGVSNPHDTLDPLSSAEIIIRHVPDGLDLARQYRMPNRIRAFIAEHHGTTLLRPFHQKALDQGGGDESKVDKAEFTYPGPRPQSRETAVLMLADAAESAVRANQPQSEEEIDSIIGRIIQARLDKGQLDESGLTLTDLQTIRRTFVGRLKGIYHPRVLYPGDQAEPEAATDSAGDTEPAGETPTLPPSS